MENFDAKEVIEVGKDTLKSNVSLGLVLASAMAWNEWIKSFSKQFLTKGNGWKYSLTFAIFVTILMVIFEIMSDKYLD